MTYLGIDYGSKYIGLAKSDEAGVLAFPLEVILNNSKALDAILVICKNKRVHTIIIGDSVDQFGVQNKITEKITEFVNNLKKNTGLEIKYEKEGFTSSHARHGGSEQKGRIDASAAALILQRFLDRSSK